MSRFLDLYAQREILALYLASHMQTFFVSLFQTKEAAVTGRTAAATVTST